MHWLSGIEKIFQAESDNLSVLANLVSDDPKRFYEGTQLVGLDISGQNLTGLSFVGSNILDTIISGDTQTDCPYLLYELLFSDIDSNFDSDLFSGFYTAIKKQHLNEFASDRSIRNFCNILYKYVYTAFNVNNFHRLSDLEIRKYINIKKIKSVAGGYSEPDKLFVKYPSLIERKYIEYAMVDYFYPVQKCLYLIEKDFYNINLGRKQKSELSTVLNCCYDVHFIVGEIGPNQTNRNVRFNSPSRTTP